eukprot:EC797781.1.p5 GENE.EC797781.1~~EC797781.1.p5  ORF type:complete len:56 (-),score=14.20 EC797781.1:229-396(-)
MWVTSRGGRPLPLAPPEPEGPAGAAATAAVPPTMRKNLHRVIQTAQQTVHSQMTS